VLDFIPISVQLYWRYTLAGKTERVAIGAYDPTAIGSPGRLSQAYGVFRAARSCGRPINAPATRDGGMAQVAAAMEAVLVELTAVLLPHLQCLDPTLMDDAGRLFDRLLGAYGNEGWMPTLLPVHGFANKLTSEIDDSFVRQARREL
jgi:hypothetical protein